MLPSASSAHVWYEPALTASVEGPRLPTVNGAELEPNAGSPRCPYPLAPQHSTSASVVRAQAWRAPALTATAGWSSPSTSNGTGL